MMSWILRSHILILDWIPFTKNTCTSRGYKIIVFSSRVGLMKMRISKLLDKDFHYLAENNIYFPLTVLLIYTLKWILPWLMPPHRVSERPKRRSSICIRSHFIVTYVLLQIIHTSHTADTPCPITNYCLYMYHFLDSMRWLGSFEFIGKTSPSLSFIN